MDIIKTMGSSGQISPGKKFAGQTVMLSEVDTGVWLSSSWEDSSLIMKNGFICRKFRQN